MNNSKIVIATKKLSTSPIIFSNSTSSQDCIDYKNISFLMADIEELCLIVPISSCAEGHHVNLYIFENDKQLRKLKKMPNDKSVLKCKVINGNIIAHEKVSKDLAEITVKITDKVHEFWDSMLEEIENKQDKVAEIFERYRK